MSKIVWNMRKKLAQFLRAIVRSQQRMLIRYHYELPSNAPVDVEAEIENLRRKHAAGIMDAKQEKLWSDLEALEPGGTSK